MILLIGQHWSATPHDQREIDGSLQLLTGESFAVNGGGLVSRDLLVPGTPTVRSNGNPTFAGIYDTAGAVAPTNYTLTLNSGALVRYVLRRVDPLAMPIVTHRSGDGHA